MISLTLLSDLIPYIQTKIENRIKLNKENKESINEQAKRVRQDLNSHAEEIGSKIRDILKTK
jgi:hypothetical protein